MKMFAVFREWPDGLLTLHRDSKGKASIYSSASAAKGVVTQHCNYWNKTNAQFVVKKLVIADA